MLESIIALGLCSLCCFVLCIVLLIDGKAVLPRGCVVRIRGGWWFEGWLCCAVLLKPRVVLCVCQGLYCVLQDEGACVARKLGCVYGALWRICFDCAGKKEQIHRNTMEIENTWGVLLEKKMFIPIPIQYNLR